VLNKKRIKELETQQNRNVEKFRYLHKQLNGLENNIFKNMGNLELNMEIMSYYLFELLRIEEYLQNGISYGISISL